MFPESKCTAYCFFEKNELYIKPTLYIGSRQDF